jgi:STE24 endopeptidase
VGMVDENVAIPDRPAEGAKQYARWKLAVGIVKLLLGLAFLVAFLLSGASTDLYDSLRAVTSRYYLQLTGYVLALSAIYYLLLLVVDYYDDVVLERRYGLSNQMTRQWLARSLKQWLLSAVLAVIAVNALYALLRHFPNWWWLLAAAGWFVLLVLVGMITPAVIVPLFYKLQPLEDRRLVDRLLALAARCGVRVKKVFEIKLSKETKKANAAVIGLFRERRIVIGDTLLDLCTHDEIEAVFAHELGHVALHHAWKMLVVGGAFSLLGFYLVHLAYEYTAAGFGFEGIDDIGAFPLLVLWLAFFGVLFRPFQAAYSRRLEKDADLFTLGRVETPASLISALTKLAGRNLADPTPNRLIELLFYTHPPIAKRIAYLRESGVKNE